MHRAPYAPPGGAVEKFRRCGLSAEQARLASEQRYRNRTVRIGGVVIGFDTIAFSAVRCLDRGNDVAQLRLLFPLLPERCCALRSFAWLPTR